MRQTTFALFVLAIAGLETASSAAPSLYVAAVEGPNVHWLSQDGTAEFGCADGESMVINTFGNNTAAGNGLQLTVLRCRPGDETAEETEAVWKLVRSDLIGSETHAIRDQSLRHQLSSLVRREELIPPTISRN